MTTGGFPLGPVQAQANQEYDEIKIKFCIADYRQIWWKYDRLARTAKDVFDTYAKQRNMHPLPLCTYRAKQPESLERKMYRRKNNDLHTILDLVGIRILLYFPDQAEQVEEMLDQCFENVYKKPRDGTSDYKACIYHITVKQRDMDDLVMPNQHTTVEVQVVSVLMHAWAEVEHERYKGINDSTPEEDRLLEELNQIVLAGEKTLLRLHQLCEARKAKQKKSNAATIVLKDTTMS
ncbi:hypothetical protein B0J11DRAFT_60507 [Dendryphion nanum]|uniref:RelA/SpoT domain-containing protein n=1 Tax=Dendryphion nanum TaxID=256645 RepID=A0A9P9DL90_9PLEO|nr:hypothetical protein B0J11DRAFT_60507 [Dendryphion nanum]